MNPKKKKIYQAEVKAEHELKENYVIDFMLNAILELNQGYAKNDKGQEFLPDRAKLVLDFTIMDVLASFWEKYNSKTYSNSSHKGSFCDWANQFCLVRKNKGYSSINMLQKLNDENLYDLRCSIVHAYCLPQKRDDTHIGILPNDCSDKLINSFAKGLSEKSDEDDIILKPDYINTMIIKGAKLMIKEMTHQIDSNPDFHIEGINRIYEELQRRGASLIPLDPKKIK